MYRALALALLLLVGTGCDIQDRLDQPMGEGTAIDQAKVFRAEMDINVLKGDLLQYYAARGEWPRDWKQLRRTRRDPWGNEYAFGTEGNDVWVFSAGPDGEFDTDDDIYGAGDG